MLKYAALSAIKKARKKEIEYLIADSCEQIII